MARLFVVAAAMLSLVSVASAAGPIGSGSSTPASAPAAPAPAPVSSEVLWLKDSASGCRVWNPNPKDAEAVSWSGPCQNGVAEGRGVVQWFQHAGGRYEGEIRNGKAEGHGVLTMPDGVTFNGEWRDGKANGTGAVEATGYHFTGIWTDGCARDDENKKVIGIGKDSRSCY